MAKQYAEVIVDKLNLRAVPGSSDRDVIGELRRGDRLEIISQRQGEKAKWLRVWCERLEKEGWAAESNHENQYCRPVAPPRAAPVPPPPRRPDPLPQPKTSLLWPLGVVGAIVLAAATLLVMALGK